MALLTPLAASEAEGLLRLYGYELSTLTALAAGSVNSNFLLEAKSGEKFFARIYEEQGPSGAEFELRVNLALAEAGVPVARPVLPKNGEYFVMAGPKPFALYERLGGESLCTKLVNPAVAASVGSALAAVHLASLGDLAPPSGRFDEAGLLRRLETVECSGRASLVAPARRVRELLDRLGRERSRALPKGLIHGDLFRDNVLVEGDRVVGLLDFESACFGNYVYDLVVTVLAWCYGDVLRRDCAKAMLDGYQAKRPLNSLEKSEISREGAFACARFATTRMTDFSLRVGDGETPIRDYRRFFARLDELEAGVLVPLL